MPKITFIPYNTDYIDVFDRPKPALNCLPEWYKNCVRTPKDRKYNVNEAGEPFQTLKACMPIFDSLTAGYIMPVQADIRIIKDNFGEYHWSWSVLDFEMISIHSNEQWNPYPVSDIYEPFAFKFNHNWIIQTDPGYSTLFIPPMWREDTSFEIMPGLVDTDKHPAVVRFPFFIKKGFNGIIKQGTPMVQMIPFKREDWTTEIKEEGDPSLWVEWLKATKIYKDRYKTLFRTKKNWG